jgi:hypothetical protein
MRILLITSDPSADTNLREPLEEIAGGDDLDLKVVAPIRPASKLDLFTGEIDEAKAGAQDRAEEAAADSKRSDAVTTAGAEPGDADQMLAIQDALAEFEAEHIVLVDPDDDDLAAAARERFGLPVTELAAG